MNVATCPKPIYTFLIYVSYQIIGGSTGYLFDVIFFMCMCGIFTCIIIIKKTVMDLPVKISTIFLIYTVGGIFYNLTMYLYYCKNVIPKISYNFLPLGMK